MGNRTIEAQAPIASRLIAGALAGTVATAPMTTAMRFLHARLEPRDRYPLPPREIVGSVAPRLPGPALTDSTLVAHFAYGALSGAGLAAVARRPGLAAGMAGGAAIWAASYLGWIPTVGILRPATRHPRRRNRLMILAHIVWGAAFSIARSELLRSRSAFGDGPLKDAVPKRQKERG